MDLTINYNEQMLNYYPEVIKAIREFQVLIETQSLQVEDLHKELTKALENAYVSTSNEDQIVKWEQFLGIVPLPQGEDTLEQWLSDRRETILARLYAPQKLNSASISDIVRIFTGGTTVSQFKDGVIHIYITPPRNNKAYKFENVEQELRQKIPAHLLFTVARNYQSWANVATDHKCDICSDDVIVDFTPRDDVTHTTQLDTSEYKAGKGYVTIKNKSSKASLYDAYLRDYEIPGHIYEIEYWIEVTSFNYRVGFQPLHSPSLDGYVTGNNVRLGWITCVTTKSPKPATNDYVSRLANGTLKGSVIEAKRDTDTANNNRQYFKILVDGINDKMTLYVKYNGEYVVVDTINLDMANSNTKFLKPAMYVFDAVPEGESATMGGVTVREICSDKANGVVEVVTWKKVRDYYIDWEEVLYPVIV